MYIKNRSWAAFWAIRGGEQGGLPVCRPRQPTEGVHGIPPYLCASRWVGKKMDDAVKKAKDKTRVRDLQQAATQQATAPEDWTGPQKLVIVI
jgi:hypothetical protein